MEWEGKIERVYSNAIVVNLQMNNSINLFYFRFHFFALSCIRSYEINWSSNRIKRPHQESKFLGNVESARALRLY